MPSVANRLRNHLGRQKRGSLGGMLNKEEETKAWCRPLFRWAGSKRALLPTLLKCAPNSYQRYIEPFAGSACLFFAMNPQEAILSDFNAELMRTYQVILRHPRQVARRLAALPDTEATYYYLRSLVPHFLGSISRAVRFYYLNRYCFNGVYRTDRRNRFNVPRGDRPGLPLTESEVYRCSVALRRATLMTSDFEETVSLARRNDFVYLDPPYSTVVRPAYGEYGYGAFAPSDVSRLISALNTLSKQGVQVLLSYAGDRAVLDALKQWSVVSIDVRRQVGGGQRNMKAVEILASNYIDLPLLAV